MGLLLEVCDLAVLVGFNDTEALRVVDLGHRDRYQPVVVPVGLYQLPEVEVGEHVTVDDQEVVAHVLFNVLERATGLKGHRVVNEANVLWIVGHLLVYELPNLAAHVVD